MSQVSSDNDWLSVFGEICMPQIPGATSKHGGPTVFCFAALRHWARQVNFALLQERIGLALEETWAGRPHPPLSSHHITTPARSRSTSGKARLKQRQNSLRDSSAWALWCSGSLAGSEKALRSTEASHVFTHKFTAHITGLLWPSWPCNGL